MQQTVTPDSTGPHSWDQRSFLSGGLISVCVHAVILLIASISLRGCENGAPSDAGGREYREIGLAAAPDNSAVVSDAPSPTPQDSDSDTPTDEQTQPTEDALPNEVPDVNSLLQGTADSDQTSDNDSSRTDIPQIVGSGFPLAGVSAGGGLPELIPPARPGRATPARLLPARTPPRS